MNSKNAPAPWGFCGMRPYLKLCELIGQDVVAALGLDGGRLIVQVRHDHRLTGLPEQVGLLRRPRVVVVGHRQRRLQVLLGNVKQVRGVPPHGKRQVAVVPALAAAARQQREGAPAPAVRHQRGRPHVQQPQGLVRTRHA